jgi:hypothetical protein
MGINQHFCEKNQVTQGFVPVGTNTGAPVVDWVSLAEYGRCAFIFQKGIGTAGDDPTITLLQATKDDGTGSKPLAIQRVDKKQSTTNLNTIGQLTVSTPAAPATNDTFTANTWTNSDLAESQAIIVIDVKAEDLDIANGFTCVSCTIAETVNANPQLACGVFILHEPRYSKIPLPSAITV